jgi:hypothetical protein
MVRVKVKKEHQEDDGFGTVNWDVMSPILTSKGVTVELGWKI